MVALSKHEQYTGVSERQSRRQWILYAVLVCSYLLLFSTKKLQNLTTHRGQLVKTPRKNIPTQIRTSLVHVDLHLQGKNISTMSILAVCAFCCCRTNRWEAYSVCEPRDQVYCSLFCTALCTLFPEVTPISWVS